MATTPLPTALEHRLAPRGEALDPELRAAIGDESAAAWLRPSSVYVPELLTVWRGDVYVAALLITHRPHTAYRKIAGSWAANDAALDHAVGALVAEATRAGAISVKWEDRDGAAAADAARNGFVALPAPVPSGAGTEAGITGYVRPLTGFVHADQPYYRQTTEYSCGPVALLMGQAPHGSASITRAEELQLWRRAAHFPGCGPTALAINADLERFRPEVFISTSERILGEHLTDPVEIEVRALVDGEDANTAAELGIPVEHRLFTGAEIAAAVASGAPVLLLIDEVSFHAEHCAHWVVAYAYQEGHFLLNDPWVDAAGGETWVDAAALPISTEDLEQTAWWGDPGYRGVVVLSPGSLPK